MTRTIITIACGAMLAAGAATVGGQPVAAGAATCVHQHGAVVVSLGKYPHIAAHIRAAIRRGQPVLLHIDRRHADQHRDKSTAVLPTKAGYDRDEYPPAMSREGGDGADVRYVNSHENRAAGASMGYQLGGYCDGQAFKLKVN
jgi:Deoxyribonuclease NucA/NucB